MNIDINNYEEYFLLYIDNELSKKERTAVEIFLQENEEFKSEFELLKSTVSAPEEKINLFDKSFLFRKEAEWINEENYEEIFVLYHDGELTEEQKVETDQFLIDHPELTGEFILLGKVKLEPEKDLIFKYKKSLYRKEESGRVIPMILWRSMAAAVFIGFGFWFFISQGNKTVVQDKMVAANVNQTSNNQIPDSPEKPLLQSEELAVIEHSKNQDKKENKNDDAKPGKQREIVAINRNKKVEKISNKISTNFIEEKTEKIVIAAISKNQIEREKLVPIVAIKDEVSIAVKNETQYTPTVNVNNVSTASYITPEPSNDNYIFYNIPADKFKKSKLGAFLKKMKRVVDRNDPLKLIFSGEEKQIARIN